MKEKLPLQFFVTGIGTGVGKTLVSAVMTEALQCDYWKPIQSGGLENTDTDLVRSLVCNPVSVFHPESYRLKTPASPHYAAALEGEEIEIEKIQLPQTNHRLLIEGAGGLLVPISPELVMYDLIEYFHLPVVVVVRNYLGSINHALLTLQFLDTQGVRVLGIVFSGNNYNDNEQIIEHFSGLPVLGYVEEGSTIDASFVSQQAVKMKQSLSQLFDF